ncbi:alkylmercury lyase family protein [Streptomyces ficellus]|uniref:Alkylmercury lyase family protein n=1 Tax=Streptomyces ficellus TaxID=1977088 RepID=A0ABT7Z9C2_9ACTN|nr:alkylmercury lyase family protein [Streptomyces ficellus]MDN3296106.1 alkylmercury lyase family protein [Streptomyces ficellus]
MELTVLTVPGCPTAQALRRRLEETLDAEDARRVEWREVHDDAEAVRLGMHGSPTLLVNGADPFVREGEPASLSCRVRSGVPSVERLRAVLAEARTTEMADRAGRGRLAPVEGGQRAVQQAVLRSFATHGRPPTTVELAAAAEPSGLPADRVLAELAAADYLSLDEAGAIRAAYPFSPVPTAHQVRIADGPRVWAMCAIDALGIAPMLGRDADIHSADPVTGQPVTVTFRGSTATWDPASAVVLVSTGSCAGPAVDACCPDLNFFASPDTARRWSDDHPEARAGMVSRQRAEELGREIFGPLLAASAG